ncbi:membrane protein [Pilimelia terevasa]|uniref:Membrane protein n=1 Tax=Pilimelia terevasa TaxID=53372 RepID=A0A8J3BP87_9ACTN|nr:phosphatidylglycerol lysyltransferase domain-containing protein [Pilimelia terevasa]GGK23485.1 membrane protein [Pilimelia terevasa]
MTTSPLLPDTGATPAGAPDPAADGTGAALRALLRRRRPAAVPRQRAAAAAPGLPRQRTAAATGREPAARPPREPGERRPLAHWIDHARVARWTARLVALVGLLTVGSAVWPVDLSRLRLLVHAVPRSGILAAHITAAAVGVLLVLLAGGLRRRKRTAWWAVVGLSAAATVLHLLKGLDWEEAGVTAALCLALVALRRHFTALNDPRSRWRAPLFGLAIAAGGVVCGVGFLAARSERLRGAPGYRAMLEASLAGLVGQSGGVTFVAGRTAHAFALLTGTFGIAALTVAVLLALRPIGRAPGAGPAELATVRRLLEAHGDADSLGYFAIRPDKDVIVSPNGQAAIAYRVLNGVSLAAGDPIGERSCWPEVIDAWLAEARRHAWAPAVIGCSEPAGEAYRRAGLDAIELGDEAILDSATFTLDGRPMRGVRQAVARMRRAGYTVDVRPIASLTPAELAEAITAADAFRVGEVERGFSMALGRLGRPDDDACVLVVARDEADRVRGLLHLVPWGGSGLSLDLMRGDRSAPNGLVELMVAALMAYTEAAGVRHVSLNFAMFRSVFARGERLGAGPVLRLWRRALLFASRFWQIESLYRANAKFRPQWRPRYLCFAAGRDLPRIGLAALRAEAFVTVSMAWFTGRPHRGPRTAPPEPADGTVATPRGATPGIDAR